MFYSYDPRGFFQFHKAADEARDAFDTAVDNAKDALGDGDSEDDISDISWGPVFQSLVYEDRDPTAEEKAENPEWDFIREIRVANENAPSGSAAAWVWSDEQPVAYGHYWFRWSDSERAEIIEVFYDEGDGIDSVRLGRRADDVSFLENYRGQWCGPIPMPGALASDGRPVFVL